MPFIASEIFNCEINQILDKFFEQVALREEADPVEEQKDEEDREEVQEGEGQNQEENQENALEEG